jgi:hypothetical protein
LNSLLDKVFDKVFLLFASERPRNRPTYAALIAVTIICGLASRKFSFLLPPLLAKNAGDVLYATMAYWLIGVLLPSFSTIRTAVSALLFCTVIEFLKLDIAPAMATIRASPAGALIFGHGFHGSNLVCYTLGTLLAVGGELLIKRKQA